MIIEDFYEYGIYVIPLNGKRPFKNEWNELPESFWKEKQYKETGNYGLVCGKRSGIIALDLDVIEPDLQKKVMSIINPSPVARYGSKKKLPTYFYQYEEKYSSKRTIPIGPPIDGKNQAIELLTNGQQCMIPPSRHPEEGHLCTWVGFPLLSADDLPLLDETIFTELAKISNQNIFTFEQGGRNNTLKSYCIAKIMEGKNPNQCIEELIEHDRKFEKPLFTDKDEKGNGNNELANATRFFFSQYNSLLKKTDLPDWRETKTITIIENNSSLDYKKIKFPKFRGLAQEIFAWIYNSSPVPRSRLAMASTFSILSNIFGNKYQFNGFLPNLYCMIISPSGYGKNTPIKAPLNLFYEAGCRKRIGEAPSSDTAILYELEKQRVRLDIIDEASRIFAGSDDSKNYMAGRIADIYADLYTSAGAFYNGKKAISYKKDNSTDITIGNCFSPHISILAAMTVEDFQNSFSERLMGKGLGGRFLFFIDDEIKKPKTPKMTKIPQELIEKVKYLTNDGIIELKTDSKFDIPSITATPEAQKMIDNYLDRLFELTKDAGKMAALSQRFNAVFHKMILIDTLAVGRDTVTTHSVQWAIDWCEAYLSYLPKFLERNLYSSISDKIEQQIENYILSCGVTGASKTMLTKAPELRRLNISTAQRNNIIKSLAEGEVLFKKDGKYFHRDFLGNFNFSN